MIRRKLADYLRLIRMDKPAGALLLLWPTLWGLWLAAEGWPGWRWFGVFVAGVVVMRAFGCVVNDVADRNYDPFVARTRNRPLAAGRISVREAVAVGAALLLCAFALWLTLPAIAKWWAVPAAAVAALYPFAKRFVALPQAVLALAFSFGIPMAFAAVRDAHPPAAAWALFLANALWVMAYDTIYAMADREDDLKSESRAPQSFSAKRTSPPSACFTRFASAGFRCSARRWITALPITSRCSPPPDLFFIFTAHTARACRTPACPSFARIIGLAPSSLRASPRSQADEPGELEMQKAIRIDDGGFAPDALRMDSPNQDARPDGAKAELLVAHGISLPPGVFGGGDVAALFCNRLDCDSHPAYESLRGLKVSAHFLISRDGRLTQFVSCARRAWHAGESEWRGRAGCNDFSVGAELEGADDVPYARPAIRRLCRAGPRPGAVEQSGAGGGCGAFGHCAGAEVRPGLGF